MADREGVETRVGDSLSRPDNELGRRLVHASGAAFPGLYLTDIATWEQVTGLLIVAASVAVVLEAVRLSVGLEWIVYQHLTREYEEEIVAGYALYLVSSAAVAVAFAPMIAAPAVLMLALADPLSGLASGDAVEQVKKPRALAVMFGACAAIAVAFVPPVVAVAGAAAATIADGVVVTVGGRVIDDDLTIAPVAALAMQAGQLA
jgi:hypothetical protein